MEEGLFFLSTICLLSWFEGSGEVHTKRYMETRSKFVMHQVYNRNRFCNNRIFGLFTYDVILVDQPVRELYFYGVI